MLDDDQFRELSETGDDRRASSMARRLRRVTLLYGVPPAVMIAAVHATFYVWSFLHYAFPN